MRPTTKDEAFITDRVGRNKNISNKLLIARCFFIINRVIYKYIKHTPDIQRITLLFSSSIIDRITPSDYDVSFYNAIYQILHIDISDTSSLNISDSYIIHKLNIKRTQASTTHIMLTKHHIVFRFWELF